MSCRALPYLYQPPHIRVSEAVVVEPLRELGPFAGFAAIDRDAPLGELILAALQIPHHLKQHPSREVAFADCACVTG